MAAGLNLRGLRRPAAQIGKSLAPDHHAGIAVKDADDRQTLEVPPT